MTDTRAFPANEESLAGAHESVSLTSSSLAGGT